MCGHAARVVLNEPPTCTARWRSRLSASASGKPAHRMMPALLTRMSRRPNRSTAASTSACAPAGVATSLVSAIASPPAATISAATAAAGPASAPSPSIEPPRSLTTTLAPALGEQQRVGPADAASRAGDDRDAPVEADARSPRHPSCTDRSLSACRPRVPSEPMPRTAASDEPRAQREVEGASRRDHRHLGAGLRAAGLPRHRHRRAVRGQRSRQGRVLPLHRVEGGAPRRDPRPGDGRGDARRRSRRRRRAGRRRRSWRCWATSCST